MEYMAQLHFDILLIMFLTFSVLFSWWKGTYKSLRFFLAVALTFLLLELFSTSLFTFFSSSNHLQIIDSLSRWMSFLPVLYENRFTVMIFVMYIIVYVVVWFIIFLIMYPFKTRKENIFTYQPKKWKKFASMVLGLLNAVLLTYIFLGGVHFIVPVQNNQILTGTIVNHTGQFTSVQIINQLRLEVEPTYMKLHFFEEDIKGYSFQESYKELINIKEVVYEIDTAFENELIPIFQNPLSLSLITTNVPEDIYDVRGYTYSLVHMDDRKTNYDLILELEFGNPYKEQIEEHFDWIIENQLVIKLLFELGDNIEDVALPDLSTAIATLESTIYTNVHRNTDVEKYKKLTKDIRYFVETREYFRGLLDIDTNLSEQDQQQTFNDALLNTTSLTALATEFQNTYASQSFYSEFQQTLDNGNLFFTLVLRHISTLVPKEYLYLSSSILSKEYPTLIKLLTNHTNKPVLNAYLNDSLNKESNQINKLYYHQLFINDWVSTYDLLNPITDTQMQAALTKISTDIQTNHYYTEDNIKIAFDYFVFDAQGIDYLYKVGILTRDSIEIMIQNNWIFLSIEAQNHLQTILE